MYIELFIAEACHRGEAPQADPFRSRTSGRGKDGRGLLQRHNAGEFPGKHVEGFIDPVVQERGCLPQDH